MTSNLKLKISYAVFDDIREMVALCAQRRYSYKKAQPQFWHHAKGAEDIQFDWFKELISHVSYVTLVIKSEDKLLGFIIG